MKDVTFGVKVPEELRDQINEMMKGSGLVGREFMQQLVDSYMLDKNKQDIPEMAEEIKELQLLTHRINEMYLYLGTRFKNIISVNEEEKQNINKEAIQSKEHHEGDIKKYRDKVSKIEEKMLQLQEEYNGIIEVNKDLNKKLVEISGYNENYKELNEQYKEKIKELTEKLEGLKPLEEENNNLLTTNNKLQENNDNLASDLWFCKREIEKLNEQLVKAKKENERYTSHLREQHHLEKQTTILELQLENQKNVERLNNKVANIQEEYNEKLKQLIFQMENTNLSKGDLK